MTQCSARTVKGRRCKLHAAARSKRCGIHKKRNKIAKKVGKIIVIEGVKYSIRRYSGVRQRRRVQSHHFDPFRS